MPLISRINKEIEKSLSSLEDAISIIEEAKITGIPISAKNSEFIDELDLAHSKELIALMLESKIRKRQAKLTAAGIVDERYQPFVITDETSLNAFTSYLAGLPLEQKYYYDFILRPIDLHSSAMQIYSDGVKARSFYIESGADLNRRFRIPINKAINADV